MYGRSSELGNRPNRYKRSPLVLHSWIGPARHPAWEGSGSSRNPSSTTSAPGRTANALAGGGEVDNERAVASNTGASELSDGNPICVAHSERSRPGAGNTLYCRGNHVPVSSHTTTRSCGKNGRHDPRKVRYWNKEAASWYESSTATASLPATVSGPSTTTLSDAARTVIGTITSVGMAALASNGGRSTIDRFTGPSVGQAGRLVEGQGSGPEASQFLPSVTRDRSLRGQLGDG